MMVVLIVESDLREAQALSTFLHALGHTPLIAEGTGPALGLLKKDPPGLVLLNLNGRIAPVLEMIEVAQGLESQPAVIVMTRKPHLEDAVAVMKYGAQDFWVKPLSFERLAKTMEGLNSEIRKAAHGELPSPAPIITQNAAMLRIKAMTRRVASSNATVFIQGESGTGKELFARYIHQESRRRDKPFVALNCAALPESLLESELFGHEKGAFTGALKAKEGKFELSNHGTLLLDEVTEIPVHLQAKLLRVLQENELDRVGGRHPIRIDVRVIATTNLTIEEAVKEGRFRKDLYYRLNVIPLKIPPLRDRPEDIASLSEYFIKKYNHLHGCCVTGMTLEATRKLQGYAWPGNVRELENVIQRGLLLSNDGELTPDALIFDEEAPRSSSDDLALMPLSEVEKRMIHKALDTVDGNRTRAAEILGISVRTLRNKLSEYRQQQGV